MIEWLSTLPQNLFLNATEQDEESRIISGMDSGPSTIRNRFSAITKSVKTSIILNGVQKEAFDEFFRDTLNHGTNQFQWKDPTTDDVVSYRFKSKPSWTCIKSGTPETRIWKSELSLEILP